MAKTKKQAESGEKKDSKKVKRKKVAGSQSYSRYYKKMYDGVLKISSQGVKVMDSFMCDIFQRLCDEASKLCRMSGRKTLTDRDMESSTKLVVGEIPLVAGAIRHARKAMRNYKNNINLLPSIPLNSIATTTDESSVSYVFVSSSSNERSSSCVSTDYDKFVANVPNRSSPISSTFNDHNSSPNATFLTPPQE